MSIKRPSTAGSPSGRCVMAEAARKIDVIDARPAYTQADADALNARFEGVGTEEMLRTLFSEGALGKVAVVSSFGTESAVLLHLVAQADKSIPVIFVDTLKMFPETLDYRETLIGAFGIENSWVVTPDPDVLAAKDDTGLRWSYDPDGCCEIRKVEPLARAKRGLEAWISGRKAFQSQTRQNLPRFEIEDGRLKLNPLGDWSKDDLEAYFAEHDLPRHPLEAQGYLSIGCEPCTSKVLPGEDPRAGRWRGWEKVECGIHTPSTPIGDPDDPANQPVF
jgi:phosphoadenosine phosphosulfate reductase